LGTNVDGSGLGLSIVKEIAQQHGASITVEASHSGHNALGACFTLRFGPLA
jgi:two-component system sensor histidine kinase TctE